MIDNVLRFQRMLNPEQGERIGSRYKLDHEIARGGMGSVWLGSDDAKEVTGRTFLATGNTVQLLSWQSQTVCQKDNTDGPWAVSEIGDAVRENFSHWPKGIQPTRRPWE